MSKVELFAEGGVVIVPQIRPVKVWRGYKGPGAIAGQSQGTTTTVIVTGHTHKSQRGLETIARLTTLDTNPAFRSIQPQFSSPHIRQPSFDSRQAALACSFSGSLSAQVQARPNIGRHPGISRSSNIRFNEGIREHSMQLYSIERQRLMDLT